MSKGPVLHNQLHCDIHVYRDGEFVETIHRSVKYGRFRNGVGYLVTYQKMERPIKRVPDTIAEYRMDL